LLCAALIACALGAPVARGQAQPSWEEISSFYAGRPITFNWDPARTGGGSTAQNGLVNLPASNRGELDALAAVLRNPKKGRAGQNAFHEAGVKGVDALAVLIHEAIHNRDFGGGPYSDNQNPSGFYGAGNEAQAGALGAELIPDLLKRFFGVGLDDPRSKQLAKWAKNRGEYTAAYSNGGARGAYEGGRR
jgi:hypothetical protein